MMQIVVEQPSYDEEIEIARRMLRAAAPSSSRC